METYAYFYWIVIVICPASVFAAVFIFFWTFGGQLHITLVDWFYFGFGAVFVTIGLLVRQLRPNKKQGFVLLIVGLMVTGIVVALLFKETNSAISFLNS